MMAESTKVTNSFTAGLEREGPDSTNYTTNSNQIPR